MAGVHFRCSTRLCWQHKHMQAALAHQQQPERIKAAACRHVCAVQCASVPCLASCDVPSRCAGAPLGDVRKALEQENYDRERALRVSSNAQMRMRLSAFPWQFAL